MTFKRKIPKDRDPDFNNCTRKLQRERLFAEMMKLLGKYPSLPKHDLLFVLNLVRHKILERTKT